MPLTLSGLVIARNEALQLPGCLTSMAGLPITVIDQGSTDETAALARAAGAQVVTASGSLSTLRALGTRLAQSVWILSLDADERLPTGGLERIRAAIAACPPQVAAFRLDLLTFMGERPLRWGGYRPRRIRLYRRAAVHWPEATVHERPEVSGRVAHLAVTINHHCYDDFDHAVAKTRRYAAWAALDLQARGRSHPGLATWLRAGWRWLRTGLFQGGLWMGPLGWRLTTLQARGVLWRGRWSRGGVPAAAACPPGPRVAPTQRHLRD